MIPSDEQKLVIEAPIKNILVSAAAGSGKTTVLVSRIIDKICKAEFGVDDILVVTFTREAASNMCDKIEKGIKSKIASIRETGEQRDLLPVLEDQLDKLPNAYIQTIDSFCTRVVQEKGYVLAGSGKDRLLEPGNTVLDGNELDLIMDDAANAAIALSYSPEYINDDFETLASMFGNGRTDDALAASLVESYKKLRSLPDYIDRAASMLERSLEYCEEGKILCLDKFTSAVLSLYSEIDDQRVAGLHELISQIQFVAKKNNDRQDKWHELVDHYHDYTSHVIEVSKQGDDLETLKAILDIRAVSANENPDMYVGFPNGEPDDDVRDMMELFGPIAAVFLFLRPLLASGKTPTKYKDSASIYKLPDDYSKIICCGADGLMDRQKKRVALAASYVDLIIRMDRFYEEFKAVVHGMDFPDQEHLALKILKTDEAGSYYRNKFREIYIDEYQDNSELQDAIIAQFENNNVFRVGDVKQSIYKFRYAEPSMFLDLLSRYKDHDGGDLYILKDNYRSDKSILQFVNRIFYRIMGEEGAEIEYDDDQALNFPKVNVGTRADNDNVPHVAVVTRDKSGNNAQCIREGVLREVKRYIEAGYEPSDICILARKHKTASMIAGYLNDNGCHARYADEIGVFNDNDIHGLCNILIAAGNELRDEYIIGILLSGYRISNFTLDEVACVILYAKKRHMSGEPLITKLRIYASSDADDTDERLRERVALFVDWFDSLRNDLIITDISELTDRIYKDTGVGASSEDPEKFILFKQWLCSNFMRYGSDISTIASRLEKMKIRLGDRTSVKIEDNSDGKIRCMTYHSSKGLEFPCVIVTELDAKVNSDKTGPVKFDPVYGTVIDDYDPQRVRIDSSLEKVFLEEDLKLGDNAELMRLLYVALTRAQNELSIVIPMESESFDSYKTLCEFLRYQTEDKCSRAFWLSCHGMQNAFLAALLSFSGSDRLTKMISDVLYGGRGFKAGNMVDFDGFVVDISSCSKAEEDDDSVEEDDADGSEENDHNNEENTDTVLDTSSKKTTGVISLYADSYDEAGMPVFSPYPYENATGIPFKISVSQIVHYGVDGSLPINLEVNGLEHYLDIRDGIIDDSASSVGTFIHRILRFIDLNRAAEDIESALDELIDDEIISAADRSKALEFGVGISEYASSELGKRLVASDVRGEAEYEKPVVFSVPEGDDSVLVQGVIDCIFKEEDGTYTIIDYKTDRFRKDITEEEMIEETIRKHKLQLECYAAAMRSSGKTIGRKYIYLIRYGKFVEI